MGDVYWNQCAAGQPLQDVKKQGTRKNDRPVNSLPAEANGMLLDEFLGLQGPKLFLSPDDKPQPMLDAATLIQLAVSEDPNGDSLHQSTLTKLLHAPAHSHEFDN